MLLPCHKGVDTPGVKSSYDQLELTRYCTSCFKTASAGQTMLSRELV